MYDIYSILYVKWRLLNGFIVICYMYMCVGTHWKGGKCTFQISKKMFLGRNIAAGWW